MILRRHLLATSCAAGALVALGLLAGCASAPVVERFATVPPGMVSTFSRSSTGSYGSGEGRVVWTHRETTYQGRSVLAAVSPTAGTVYYDPATYGVVATLSASGQPTASYDPPLGNPWPLQVGKTWVTKHMVVTPTRTTPVEVRGKVEAYEEVTVPAGTFKTYRVVTVDSLGEQQTVWTAPADGVSIVKRTLVRAATHPLGAGTLEGVLLSRSLPR